MTAKRRYKKLATFIIKTAVAFYSPKDYWNFLVETTDETKEKLFIVFFEFLIKKRLKIEERQKKVDVEEDQIEEVVECECREA